MSLLKLMLRQKASIQVNLKLYIYVPTEHTAQYITAGNLAGSSRKHMWKLLSKRLHPKREKKHEQNKNLKSNRIQFSKSNKRKQKR